MANSHFILPIADDDSECLVFGLTWSAVIGPRPAKESIERVRSARATHYVPAGESTVVGYITLKTAKRAPSSRARSLYSAAVVFAEAHPQGLHALVARINEDHYWLIASHDGVVISGTDGLFDSYEEAEQSIQLLRARYTDIRIANESLSLDANKKPATAKLIELKTSFRALPLWLRVSCAAVLAYAVLDQGLSAWQRHVKALEAANSIESSVDAVGEWDNALNKWQDGVLVDGQTGLNNLLEQAGGTPLKLGGWTLQHMNCKAVRAGWGCTGSYFRQANATNTSLKLALPTGWTVSYKDLYKAETQWQLPATRKTLDRLAIGQTEEDALRYSSMLQGALAAFKTVTISPRVQASVPTPTYTASTGETLSIPAPENAPLSARVPGRTALDFDGPLRSLTVLTVTDNTTIKQLTVEVHDYIDPTVNSSLLTGHLLGDMYVK
ncbi:hypothetical protein M0K88_004699 [Escherichia coli]|nr:type 4b pilus protein PilO2 [Escherichia coli]